MDAYNPYLYIPAPPTRTFPIPPYHLNPYPTPPPTPSPTTALRYPNGDRYEGQVAASPDGNWIPHGHGTKYFVNGDRYTGSFVNGAFQGQGHYTYANGSSYKGTYQNGLRHGHGDFWDAHLQRRYVGDYLWDVEDGYAVITRNAPRTEGGQKKYEGRMRAGRREGEGVQYVTGPDGRLARFEGNWRDGVLNGAGSQDSVTQCLQGNFVNGYLEGQGMYVNPTAGDSHTVVFRNGKMVRFFN